MNPTALIALLAIAGSTPGLPAQEPAVSVHESRLVPLEQLPASQRRALVAARPVGEWLELDGLTFALELDREHLRVATRAGREPDRSLKGERTLQLNWERDGQRRERELRFEPGPEGWRYGPARGQLFDLEGESLCLIDANLDGEFDLLHDAWSARPGAPLQPLGEHLVLGDRRLRIAHLASDGTRLEGTFETLAGDAVQRAALRRLNHLRRADGLGPVELEPELSAGCTAHAAYLEANGWRGQGDPHEQDARGQGASREGRAAARSSQILARTPEQAIDDLWATVPGRRLLCDPDLVALGISSLELPLAVLDLSSRATHKSLGKKTWSSPLLSPADGSFGHPTRYGDTPSKLPVAGAQRMGPPLVLWVLDAAADVEQYSGELYKLTGRTRRLQSVVQFEPVQLEAVQLEDGPGKGTIHGILPSRPLASGARYVVVHRLVLDGEPRTIEARFETR